MCTEGMGLALPDYGGFRVSAMENCQRWLKYAYHPSKIFENKGANLCTLVQFDDTRSSTVGKSMLFHPTFKEVKSKVRLYYSVL